MKTKDQKVEQSLIFDYEAGDVGVLLNKEIKGTAKIDTKNETDLQKLFDFFARNNLSPFYPDDRSIGRVKEAIYRFFENCLAIKYTEKFSEVINNVLSPKNKQHFVNVIDSTKEKYITETQRKEIELKTLSDWELPELLNYGGNYSTVKVKKSAMLPFYRDGKWKPEEAFIKLLDGSDKIEWWFKGGDRDAIFFAVPYTENKQTKPFYVDFIVKFKNGNIGLFDTKSGRTIIDAKEKSDGLQKSLKDQNKKKKNLTGGIVANTDSTNFSGRWMSYTGPGGDLKVNDFSNWDLLEI